VPKTLLDQLLADVMIARLFTPYYDAGMLFLASAALLILSCVDLWPPGSWGYSI
jgi:hypothetical protein